MTKIRSIIIYSRKLIYSRKEYHKNSINQILILSELFQIPIMGRA